MTFLNLNLTWLLTNRSNYLKTTRTLQIIIFLFIFFLLNQKLSNCFIRRVVNYFLFIMISGHLSHPDISDSMPIKLIKIICKLTMKLKQCLKYKK